MSAFTQLNLSGDRVLVKGTDNQGTTGQTVVDSSEWNDIKRRQSFGVATEGFDTAVEEFFAPLMEAAEQLEQALAVPKPDPISYVVFDEGSEGTATRTREVHKLSPDSVVLRILESGNADRLVWVNDTLEVLELDDELPFEDSADEATGHDPFENVEA